MGGDGAALISSIMMISNCSSQIDTNSDALRCENTYKAAAGLMGALKMWTPRLHTPYPSPTLPFKTSICLCASGVSGVPPKRY